MKRGLLIFLAVVLCMNSFGQSGPEVDYLKKSKSQNLIASLLAGGGGAVFIGGLIMYPKDYDWLFGSTPEKESQVNTASTMLLIGITGMIASIPVFVASGQNSKRALRQTSLRLKFETQTALRQRTFADIPMPALSLTFHL